MIIVKNCVLWPISNTFDFDFGLFYENKNFLEGRNRVEKMPKIRHFNKSKNRKLLIMRWLYFC